MTGLYHDACGTLNGRMLRDGSLLYGCTCNMSLSTAALHGLAFDTSFSSAAFEARPVPQRLSPAPVRPCL